MIKSYRTIYHLNQWLTHFLGSELLVMEKKILEKFFINIHKKNTLLIGVPAQFLLLNIFQNTNKYLITPLVHHKNDVECIEAQWNQLPVFTGGVDIVVLPHALECTDDPKKLLTEACRIVKPEGYIVIFGFNPYSLWGMKNRFKQDGFLLVKPEHFLAANLLKKWLSLNDFELVKQKNFLFRPPLKNDKIFKKIKLLEGLGSKLNLPWGGAYVLIAKAKYIAVTPIRLHWKQEVTNMQPSISRVTVRSSQ